MGTLLRSDSEVIAEVDIQTRYFDGTKAKIKDIAIDTIDALRIITILDNEDILYYQDGIYKHGGEKRIKEFLLSEKGLPLKVNHMAEIYNQVKARTYVPRERINSNPYYIHMENGIYNLQTGEFGEFDPEIYATNKIPVKYDPEAKCPAIEKFLTEVLSSGDAAVVRELFGYSLYKGYPFQLAFMFVGCGANGKSTLLNIFKSMIGADNISNVSLHEMARDRFSSSDLFGKMLNIYPDLSSEALKSTGLFKALTGGDTISAQKKFKDCFHFENQAKLIFSCNTLPHSKDDSDAFFRRWIIIEFPHVFDSLTADKFLIKKLTTETELSGLFNLAILELHKILKQDGFSFSETTQKSKERYIRLSNSLRAFTLDCIEPSRDSFIGKDELYDHYLTYCEDNDLEPYTKTNVGRVLPTISNARDSRNQTSGTRKTGWTGIKVNIEMKETFVMPEKRRTYQIDSDYETEDDYASRYPDG